MGAVVDINIVIGRVFERHADRVCLDVSTYTTLTAKARFIDAEFGEWWATPHNVANGRGHPKRKSRQISISRTVGLNEAVEKIRSIHGESLTLDESTYRNASKPARFIDPDHGEFWMRPAHVFGGHGHRKRGVARASQERIVSAEEAQIRLDKVHAGRVRVDPATWNGAKDKAHFVDIERGHWWAHAYNVMAGQGHPGYTQTKIFSTKVKNGTLRQSQPERDMRDFLKTLDPQCRPTLVFLKRRQFQIDAFLPSKAIAVEYNGLYWHSDFNSQQYSRKHLDKTKACALKNIDLIHIWGHEWEYKRPLVESYLSARFGKFSKRIHARKCTIDWEVGSKETRHFLDEAHLLGTCSHAFRVALRADGEIVAIAVLGAHHRQDPRRSLVVKRIAFAKGVQVIGGFSRLTSAIRQRFPLDRLVTWVERRLSSENSYVKAGWKVEAVLPPDYFYFNKKTHQVVSKQSRKKILVGTPLGMTEFDHAKQSGFGRVYDCGKIRLVLP